MILLATYEHLYAMLNADGVITALFADNIYNYAPEDIDDYFIYLGQPVISEDRSTKTEATTTASQLVEMDLQVGAVRSPSAGTDLATVTSLVVGALNRKSDPTARQGYTLEFADATLGPRLDDDTHLIGVIRWTGLLRQA